MQASMKLMEILYEGISEQNDNIVIRDDYMYLKT